MRSRWAYSQVSARPELTAATLAVWEYYRGAAWCDIARNAHVSQRAVKGLVSEMRRTANLPRQPRTARPQCIPVSVPLRG